MHIKLDLELNVLDLLKNSHCCLSRPYGRCLPCDLLNQLTVFQLYTARTDIISFTSFLTVNMQIYWRLMQNILCQLIVKNDKETKFSSDKYIIKSRRLHDSSINKKNRFFSN